MRYACVPVRAGRRLFRPPPARWSEPGARRMTAPRSRPGRHPAIRWRRHHRTGRRSRTGGVSSRLVWYPYGSRPFRYAPTASTGWSRAHPRSVRGGVRDHGGRFREGGSARTARMPCVRGRLPKPVRQGRHRSSGAGQGSWYSLYRKRATSSLVPFWFPPIVHWCRSGSLLGIDACPVPRVVEYAGVPPAREPDARAATIGGEVTVHGGQLGSRTR